MQAKNIVNSFVLVTLFFLAIPCLLFTQPTLAITSSTDTTLTNPNTNATTNASATTLTTKDNDTTIAATNPPTTYEQPESPKHNNEVDTNFFDNFKDDGKGCGVFSILKLIIDILSFGIAIAGTIGLVICGISYLTAKGNEAQITKARHRIFEIVLGLAIYTILWFILNFLLPGGNFNTDQACSTTTSSSSSYGQKPTYTPSKPTSSKSSSKKNSKSSSKVNKDGSTAAGQKIIKKAEEVAKDFGKYHFTYYNYSKGSSKNATSNWAIAKSRKTANCNTFVSFAMQRAGVIKKNTSFYFDNGIVKGINNEYIKNHKKLKVKQNVNKTIATLVKNGDVVPGDAVGPSSGHHTMIYVKHKNGKYYYHSVNGPTGQKLNPKSVLNVTFRSNGGYKIGAYIHAK